jgi:hypothetical protein
MTGRTPLFILPLLFVAAAGAARAQATDDRGTGFFDEKVRVSLVFETTYPRGAADVSGEAFDHVSPGGSGAALGGAKLLENGGLCLDVTRSGATGGPEAQFHRGTDYLWYAEFEALEAGMRNMTVAVDWSRYDATDVGAPIEARGDRRLLTLEEGERHLLDWVDHQPAEHWYCGRSAAVYVEVDVVEDPELADETIGYELWLVIEENGGGRITRHARAAGRQGERIELDLPAVRWPLPDVRFADGRQVEVAGEFGASVRGRVRPDGSIAVDLRAGRWLGLAPAGEERRGGIGDGGRRVVRLEPGEAVELVLPETQGGVQDSRGGWNGAASKRLKALANEAPPGWPGYGVDDGVVLVHNPTYFRDMKMSVILEATRRP